MFKTMINTAIESFQAANKIAIDTFVKNEGLAETFHKFVDTQTDYSKNVIDAGFNASTKMFNFNTVKSNTQKGK